MSDMNTHDRTCPTILRDLILLCALGSEGFLAGKHHWEVEVGNRESWTIDVARTSVKRKRWFCVKPEEGIWALRFCWNQFQALTYPQTSVTLSIRLTKIRVYQSKWHFTMLITRPPSSCSIILSLRKSSLSFLFSLRDHTLKLCPGKPINGFHWVSFFPYCLHKSPSYETGKRKDLS